VGIDPQSRRSILDTVKHLNVERKMSVLYTTHYMEEAQELSHRIGIIDHGQIIGVGTLDELIQTIGQYDTVKLQVPSDGLDGVVAKLKALPNVSQAEQIDGEIRLIAKEGRKVLPEAIRVLNEAGVTLNALEVQAPNLEAVFLQLTGRALRD
jgi:ABC-2 type transport system ATP-binding protein